MKKQKAIFTDIDFADSEYKSMEMSNENLIIILTSWDEGKIAIKFLDVIQLQFRLGDGISGIYEDTSNHFLDEALSRCYTKIPESHSYRYYEIRDLQGFPRIQIVGTEANAKKN